MNYLNILKSVFHFAVPDLLSCLVILVIKPRQNAYCCCIGQAYQDPLSAYLWYDIERIRLESSTRPRGTCLAEPPHKESSFSQPEFSKGTNSHVYSLQLRNFCVSEDLSHWIGLFLKLGKTTNSIYTFLSTLTLLYTWLDKSLHVISYFFCRRRYIKRVKFAWHCIACIPVNKHNIWGCKLLEDHWNCRIFKSCGLENTKIHNSSNRTSTAIPK